MEGDVLGVDFGLIFRENVQKTLQKSCFLALSEFSAGFRGIPRDPAEVAGASAARDLPSTRAGGQDDVSSQADSLKISGFSKFSRIFRIFLIFVKSQWSGRV